MSAPVIPRFSCTQAAPTDSSVCFGCSPGSTFVVTPTPSAFGLKTDQFPPAGDPPIVVGTTTFLLTNTATNIVLVLFNGGALTNDAYNLVANSIVLTSPTTSPSDNIIVVYA